MSTCKFYLAETIVSISCLAVLFLARCGAQEMFFPGTEWARVAPEAELVDSARLQVAVDYLDVKTPIGGSHVGELTIIRNGRMIWEGPDNDKRRTVYSVTKSLTSTILGLLVDEGRATLDMRAADFAPSLDADYPDVTLRHLTTMTSGYQAVGEAGEWLWSNTPFVAKEPFFTPPGSQYFYSGSAMEQFSNVLTQIAGERIEDLFRRRITDPIGMSGWYWPNWVNDAPGDGYNPPESIAAVNAGSTGFSVSARELARFGHLFLNQGRWDGEQLISAEWVDAATSVQVPSSLPRHPLSTGSSISGPGVYGYNWWVNGIDADGSRLLPGAPSRTYAALGKGGNLVFIVPEWDMVISRTAEDDELEYSEWGAFLEQIGSALLPSTKPIILAMSPGQSYTVVDNDQDSAFDDLGDKTNDRQQAVRCTVGEVDLEDRNSVTRLVAKFGLANLPHATARLESATLRLFLEDVGGLPAGPVSIWHGIDDNDMEETASDYQDLGYEDTLLDLVVPGDEEQAYYELDVTEFVAADYAADGDNPLSAFRLQVNEAVFLEDDQSHRYRFTMPGAGTNPPELVLTFIPEPSTLVLTALGLLGLLTHVRRRNAA